LRRMVPQEARALKGPISLRNCTAPFADTHRPPPTFADGTDRTMFSFGRGMGLAGWQRSKIPIVLSVASRPARELTVRSAKPGIKSTLDANCTDGDAFS
jgi:hypothetical protein